MSVSECYVLVLVQLWEESELGWGVRPDGFSIHRDEEHHLAYSNAHWNGMRARYGDRTPEEYSREDGDAVWMKFYPELADELISKTLVESGNVRYFRNLTHAHDWLRTV